MAKGRGILCFMPSFILCEPYMEFVYGVGFDDSSVEGLITKKVRFKDKVEGSDRDSLVDQTTIPSVSWKDLLVSNSNPDSRRPVAPFGVDADEDLDMLEGDIKKLFVNGPKGVITLISKWGKDTLHGNNLLDKRPGQNFGLSVALEGENPSLLDQVVKAGRSHQAQLVDVEEIIGEELPSAVGDDLTVRAGVSLISSIQLRITHFNLTFEGPVEFVFPILEGGLDLVKYTSMDVGTSNSIGVGEQNVSLKNPRQLDIVCLLKPRINGKKADNVIVTLGFHYSHRVEAIGFSGGIWLGWKDTIRVEVQDAKKEIKECRFVVAKGWIVCQHECRCNSKKTESTLNAY
ncbi:hypothetical protein PVK06_034386 [Gossypium arboreum]|uniref:Uncharacterized protein n=1 Tax=Gossypium arboreum TaxID=29729 RepID=A0ABR0NG62_GOSAR|nr:hypothetical protein PVK06_034386 [Gossypium arboreum]